MGGGKKKEKKNGEEMSAQWEGGEKKDANFTFACEGRSKPVELRSKGKEKSARPPFMKGGKEKRKKRRGEGA